MIGKIEKIKFFNRPLTRFGRKLVMKQEIIAIGDSGSLESNKSRNTYKITISILFGLIGFVINFHGFDYLFLPYSATILIGLLFPMLISCVWQVETT